MTDPEGALGSPGAARRVLERAVARGATGRAIGKAILVGEHFVVHGVPAIAVPVRGRWVEVAFGRSVPALSRRHPESERAKRAILAMLVELGVEPATLELELEVGGDLPLGAGLGGSAAVAAALGRALEVPPAALEAFVHRMETLAHGTPSGIDGAVVCAERAAWFEVESGRASLTWLDAAPGVAIDRDAVSGRDPRSLASEPPSVRTSGPRVIDQLPLWVAVVPRQGTTKDAVARVAAFRSASPEAFADLAAAARQDAFEARRCLERGDLDSLGAIFDRAQARLEQLGVSTPPLEALVLAAREAGALGAKLSGAGLGGAVIALAPPGLDLGPALSAAGAMDVIAPGVAARHPTIPRRALVEDP